jgi:organic hydroperoxide reductase OsmC/OhrA
MEKAADGNMWMSRVVLRPDVHFAGAAPDAATLAAMHDKAHHACFIANSVKTTIIVEPAA